MALGVVDNRGRMTIGDKLVRAAVYAAMDTRDNGGDLRKACAEIVNVHRAAPLAEYAVELKLARRALILAEAAHEARHWERETPDWAAA